MTFHYWRQSESYCKVNESGGINCPGMMNVWLYVSVWVSGNWPWQRFHHSSPSDHQLQGTLWWILRTRSPSWIILKHIHMHTHAHRYQNSWRWPTLHWSALGTKMCFSVLFSCANVNIFIKGCKICQLYVKSAVRMSYHIKKGRKTQLCDSSSWVSSSGLEGFRQSSFLLHPYPKC